MESGAQRCVGSGNSPVVLERVESAAKKVPLSPKVIQGSGGSVPEASSILAVWVLDSSPPSRAGIVPTCCADPYLSLRLALFGLSLCMLTPRKPSACLLPSGSPLLSLGSCSS